MKFSSACISIALIALAASVVPAKAADWNNGAGGIKDSGQGGTPIPAPIPYQESYKWYLKGDVGFGIKNQNTATSVGTPMNITQQGEFDKIGILGASFGRYITPSLRLEFGIDIRNKQNIATGQPFAYTTTRYADGGVQTAVVNLSPVVSLTGPSRNYNTYDAVRTDDATHNNVNGMINIYYDLKNSSRFTPYVGVGVGLVLHTLQHRGKDTGTCFTGGNTILDLNVPPLPPGCHDITVAGPTYLPSQLSLSSGSSTTAWGLAAAIMAGGTYSITDRTHWDIGYRGIWQGGSVSTTINSIAGDTRLRFDPRFEHEIRTGIRFDVW
jgi:opacity protein-like surface antigen